MENLYYTLKSITFPSIGDNVLPIPIIQANKILILYEPHIILIKNSVKRNLI